MERSKLKSILLSTNYFIDNNYLEEYLDLAFKNEEIADNLYAEKHHIIPVAIYKVNHKCKTRNEALKLADSDSNNIIKTLLYKDHVYAHYLLYFCTKGKVKHGMSDSVQRMITIYSKLSQKTHFQIPSKDEFNELQKLFEKIVEDSKSRFWTQSQINILKSNYSDMSIQEIANILHKSYSATKSKALSLKLRRNVNLWTEQEIKLFEENYNKYGSAYCAKLINRSINAISSKAKELGIKRTERNNSGRFWTKEEDEFLKTNYKSLGSHKCAEILTRSYTAITTRAKRLGLAEDIEDLKYSDIEIQFLKDNYMKYGSAYCVDKLNRSEDAIKRFVNHNLKLKRLPQGSVIYCPELNKTFQSILQASRELGISDGNICAIVNGKIKSTKGLTFYKINKEEYYKNNKKVYPKQTNMPRKIIQLSLDGKCIATFNSITEATKSISLTARTASLSMVCMHKRNKAYGYKWMYLDEWEKL